MVWFFVIALAAMVVHLKMRLTRLEQLVGSTLVVDEPGETNPAQRLHEIPAPERFDPDSVEPVDDFVSDGKYATAQDGNRAAESDATAGDQSRIFAFPRFRFDFEDIFGRRLPIWAGGIALAVAGIFLVRYSIEAGLLTAPVRVALSFLFGIMLLLVAEAAHRLERFVADVRVRQALAGAGLATLYAAFYLAGTRYGLIGPAIAFAGLAAVSALAVALTFRFGLPAAILGLVGGFATPVLVASDETNVPVLAFYLAVLTAGFALTGRRTGRPWLGYAALFAAFVWAGLLITGTGGAQADIVATGFYLLTLGAVVPLLAGGTGYLRWGRPIAGGLAALQLATLVAQAGYDLLTWGLYLLLAAALAVLGWTRRRLRLATALALATGAFLLATWPDPAGPAFALVMGALAVLGTVTPLGLLLRSRPEIDDVVQIAVGTLALGVAALIQFAPFDNDVAASALASGIAALAIIPAIAAMHIWRSGQRDTVLVLPVASASILCFAALHLILPDWIEIVGATVVTCLLALLLSRRPREDMAWLVRVFAAVTAVTLLSTGDIFPELETLIGADSTRADFWRTVVRWSLFAMAMLGWMLVERGKRSAHTAQAASVVALYGLTAQALPSLALAPLLSFAALAAFRLFPARAGLWQVAIGLAALWATWPLFIWMGENIEALAKQPAFFTQLPGLQAVLLRFLPLATAAITIALWTPDARYRRGLGALGAILAAAAAHVLFKQLFTIEDYAQFVHLGLAERTVWQTLLAGTGIAVASRLHDSTWRWIAPALVAAALFHFAWFGFVLHNPLWDGQWVGPVPVANLLTPSYLVAIAAMAWLARWFEKRSIRHIPAAGAITVMVLVGFFALSLLRQAFAGTVPSSAPLGETEDLLRSLLGIALALGFLVWGMRTGQRSWRIGSLVLMLLAVVKVFLIDAAGLEGLLRIVSFLALGFSLIGIGWFYSRRVGLTAHTN